MFLMKVDNQVKANGGVTYRGQFYPIANGRPVGIPDGGRKFDKTTASEIDWSRFNVGSGGALQFVPAPTDAGFPLADRFTDDATQKYQYLSL